MRFTLEIDEDFLDIFDSLSELVLDQPVSTPEEALEYGIFTHLQFQLTRNGQDIVPV